MPDTALLSVRASEWRIKQAVLLDWHDGPITGICELEHPKVCFYFDLFAEFRQNDDLDDRLFRVYKLPIDEIDVILSILRPLGEPKGNIWVPIWSFPSNDQQVVAEQALNQVINQREPTQLIFRATNLENFLGVWNLT